jgi:hypothetical protein
MREDCKQRRHERRGCVPETGATGEASSRGVSSSDVVQDVSSSSAELKAAVAELRAVVAGYEAICMQRPTEEHQRNNRSTLKQMGLGRAAEGIAGKCRVPVLTQPVAVRPDAVYEGLPYVTRVLPDVFFVGGINLPKKVVVQDSFGQVCACACTIAASMFGSAALTAKCMLWIGIGTARNSARA